MSTCQLLFIEPIKICYNFVLNFQFLGAFELAVIRMSRYYDLSQNAVLFGDFMLPMEAFMTTRDTTEMKLVSQIFDFARALAEFRLSDEQLALYSGYILLQDGKSYILLLSKNTLISGFLDLGNLG